MTLEDRLPSGWLEVDLGELFTSPTDDIVDGPFGSNLKASEYVESGVPIARLQNIDRNRFVNKNIKYVTLDKAVELSRHTFMPEDILITKLGDPLGKACLAPKAIELGVLVADVVRARITHPWVDPLYLCQQINSEAVIEQFKDETKGTTRPRVNLTKIRSLRVRLCPLSEQRRITERLELLLSDLDAGMEELKAARKLLAKYRQALLKAAVDGGLTAEWRLQHSQSGEGLETGAKLLERILLERRARWEEKQLLKYEEQGKAPPKDWENKYPEPVQPDLVDLAALPQGWVWASLDMLGEIVSGVAKGTKRDSSVAVREVPYLRVANVQRGYLDLNEVKTIFATERDIKDLTLEDGDVLFNEGGDRDKLGRGWVWKNEVAGCIHQNHVFRMRPYLPDTLPELISHHGNTFGRAWFQTVGKQTTNLASINMGMLRAFPVPIAPAEEQREVLTLLEVQSAVLDAQEESVDRGIRQAEAQRRNILRAAFAGELVSQDPDDEPAIELLNRIRANRSERDSQPKSRKAKAIKEVTTMVKKLFDVLAEAADWIPAQEVFRRCGIVDGTQIDQVEALYAELRALDKASRLAVEPVTDTHGRKLYDRLRLLPVT